MIKGDLNILKHIGIPVFLAVVLLLFVKSANSQTWTGNVSNSWHDAGNWNSGVVPGSNSTVTIRSVSPQPFPVITQNVTVKEINLPDWSSGELTVTNNATLTVSETFNINNNGKLILDNGILQFDGNGNGSRKIKMGWTNTLIQITNNGVLNSPYSPLQINGEIQVNEGTLNLGNGFQVSTDKLLHVITGDINIFGEANIYGIIDGGTGNFVFDGNLSDNSHKAVIRSGGRFYMAPSSPGNHPPQCDPNTPDPPVLSGGTIDFKIPSSTENNGRLYGGDALITLYESTETQGDAGIEIHNGTLVFKGNSDVKNSGYMKITCIGSILIEGNSTFQQSGSIDVGDGNFGVAGDASFQNSGALNAGEGDITFEGNVTIANSGGTINAGSSTIHFSGGTFDNSGTFDPGTSTFIFDGDGEQEITGKNSDITFYNLIVEDGSIVQSGQNVLVLNDMTVDENGEFNLDPGKTLNVVGDVTGDPFVGTNRPYIIEIRINSQNSITAVFNESLDPASAQTASNYRIENQAGSTIDYPSNPLPGGAGNKEVTLTLGYNMVENVKYYLIVNNVKNLLDYTVSPNHKKRFGLTEPAELWRWAGIIDSDWDTPGNWVKNMLPPTNAVVVIPVTPNNPIISSAGIQISELKIESGASLTIGPTANLSVNNSIQNQAGVAGLIIASNEEGTGSLIHNNNSVPASFQRYISGEPQTWQMISSPVTSQSISGNFTPAGGENPYGDGTRYDFYAWYEPDTSWVYLLNDNQPPTWNTANGNSNFIPGRGYLVSYKDPHPTKVFEGNLNNGSVSIEVIKTLGEGTEFGQNLLGNPYPSSIDWKAASGWNRDNLATNGGGYEIWIWSETNLNYGAYNSAASADEGTLGVTRYIAPNQGFFVKAAQSGTVTMNNSVRVNQGAGNWLKSAKSDHLSENIKITIESAAGQGRDEVVVEFGHRQNESGTRKKFSFIPSAPAVFIPGNELFYSIRMVGEKEKNAVLPVSFKAGVAGNYNLTAGILSESFDFLELYDKLTGIRHNLKAQPTYLFQATPKDRTDRFILQVAPGNFADPHSSLPVNIFARQKRLYVDMRLVTGQFYCDVFNLSGQQIAKKVLYGGDVTQLNIPLASSVVIVHISGNEGKIYKKVPVF
jgi:hypothetical protein